MSDHSIPGNPHCCHNPKEHGSFKQEEVRVPGKAYGRAVEEAGGGPV